MDMLNGEVNYVYEIKYNKESTNKNNRCLVKSKIKPEDMCDLILYIQYKYKSIIPQSDLTEYEVKEVLVNCYEAECINNLNVDEIIYLQDNFKRLCNKDKGKKIIDKISRYEVKGLIGELQKIVYLAIEM
ncbi:hypothetical protein SR42_11315 [Clostridium botulinum]|uniref:hypothetical protein n=1 Tax=Clostridium botulinum TaxID=1491 RepID=UPI000597E0FC|nr:hypothetical protein [Clostridium botulinum]KIL09540.1 hypothetical protein SR42_11315 [Clostridium botulinum]MBY6933248.1 hypothetical protein [Clostridium botulinum]NFL82642.1 hypothetical protein [Clostridium botulinum]NFN11224.1 hypothetical protein [Clostridium botulinum]NFO37265.1 hypothetical protein [Clostridium botulinum]